MRRAFRALPDNNLGASGTNLGRQQSFVHRRVPLSSDVRKQIGERFSRRYAVPGAERTALAFQRTIPNLHVPFVSRVYRTAPPHFLVTVRPHILRREPRVARRMPLRSEFRVRFRERIGDRHGGSEYPFRTSTQSDDCPLPAPLPGCMDLWGRVPGVSLVPRFTPGYFPARRWRASLLGGCKMTLAPTRGEFTGSLLLPANGRRVTFTGASMAAAVV